MFDLYISWGVGQENEYCGSMISAMFYNHIKLNGGKLINPRRAGAPEGLSHQTIIRTDLDLTPETGFHRIIRISPFDKQKRRWTTLVEVCCVPQDEKLIKIEVWQSFKSYFFHPYVLVRNHKTGEVSSKLEDILNGDFSSFAPPLE